MSEAITQLNVGDRAPAFTLKDAAGSAVSLADYAGRSVVVYFYPKAATPGCTTEACDFRDNLNSLAGAGYDVVGISSDGQESLQSFADDQSLTFPLLSDPDHSIAKAYGAYGDKDLGGKIITGTLRSTIVVNPDGTVKSAEYNVDAQGHVARLREELGV
ncbi:MULTISPECIES: thioredoxin-dependent thiol peroxidase [Micrococcaceae]|uniref:thioredoxin-dependent thiol peroxidase n=1 Tax=Micrococcaceae TaxID=1268 RepID=UPI000BB6D7B2|nr:thioredoxin-dependent thiol peroxidase [Glutamicibacter sp. BW78]PCC24398.1 thioredoxin-dependent thiol peroxidase [Glutamicibacter sp. BW78]